MTDFLLGGRAPTLPSSPISISSVALQVVCLRENMLMIDNVRRLGGLEASPGPLPARVASSDLSRLLLNFPIIMLNLRPAEGMAAGFCAARLMPHRVGGYHEWRATTRW